MRRYPAFYVVHQALLDEINNILVHIKGGKKLSDGLALLFQLASQNGLLTSDQFMRHRAKDRCLLFKELLVVFAVNYHFLGEVANGYGEKFEQLVFVLRREDGPTGN